MKKLLLSAVCAVTLFGAASTTQAGLKEAGQAFAGVACIYGGVMTYLMLNKKVEKKKREKINKTVLPGAVAAVGGYLLKDAAGEGFSLLASIFKTGSSLEKE